MSGGLEMTSIRLAHGDACIIVRKDGSILTAYPQDGEGEPAAIVAGLAMCLDNEDWVQALIRRVRNLAQEKKA